MGNPWVSADRKESGCAGLTGVRCSQDSHPNLLPFLFLLGTELKGGGVLGQVLPWEAPPARQPPKIPAPREGTGNSDHGACLRCSLVFGAKLNCTIAHFPIGNGSIMHQISRSKVRVSSKQPHLNLSQNTGFLD